MDIYTHLAVCSPPAVVVHDIVWLSLFPACEEAVELYSKQMKLQEERRPQESKAYIKIRVRGGV